jgi:predicted lipoprotein with Yx(FWY)xxD motif
MIGTARRPLLAVAAGAVVLLAACGSSSSTSAGTSPTTVAATSSSSPTTVAAGTTGRYGSATSAPPTSAAASGPVVSVVVNKLGLTLVDANGHTLYEYQPDPAGSSTCTGGCASAWPPLTVTTSTIAVGKGLTASMFTTVAGASGAKIVAIAGHPLYRFSGDTAAGQTNGEGVGGIWHAAGPIGNTM